MLITNRNLWKIIKQKSIMEAREWGQKINYVMAHRHLTKVIKREIRLIFFRNNHYQIFACYPRIILSYLDTGFVKHTSTHIITYRCCLSISHSVGNIIIDEFTDIKKNYHIILLVIPFISMTYH